MTHLAPRTAVVLLMLVLATPVLAQEVRGFEAAVGVATATLHELDTNEVGISGRFGWRLNSLFGIETELAFFPTDEPDRVTVTTSRTELSFGVTVGPQLGRVRPFGRIRPGLLHVAEARQPVACILIYPPPLSCTLAGGASLFILDVGGGVELTTSERTFVRFDAGDRLTRYPGPAFTRDRVIENEDFFGHDFRFGVGVGWRF
jgi:hypothetical protein